MDKNSNTATKNTTVTASKDSESMSSMKSKPSCTASSALQAISYHVQKLEFTARQYEEERNFDIDVIAAAIKSVHLVSEGLTKYCDRLLGIIEDKHPNTDTLSAEMKTKFSQSAHKEQLNISALDH